MVDHLISFRNVLGTSTKPVLKEVKSNDLPATHAKKAKKNKLTLEDEPKPAKKRKKVTAQVEDVSPYNLYVNKADELDTKRLSGNERNEAGTFLNAFLLDLHSILTDFFTVSEGRTYRRFMLQNSNSISI